LGDLESARAGELGVVVEFTMPFGRTVTEAGEVSFPSEFNITDGAISLLGNDDFCLPCKLGFVITAVVVFFAVHEHDNVGILLDGT